MNWRDKTWSKEDKIYYPKRRVDNKISWQRPHIIGTFASVKMQRDVEFHSLNERLFYYFLELDIEVLRYYVQPIEVEMPYLDLEGQEKSWFHVPDVLVYRQGYLPQLYQLKESPEGESKTFELCNKRCESYARKHDWNYQVIFPKQLPEVIQSNINMLVGFLKRRKTYSQWEELVLYKLESLGGCSIVDLARSFTSHVDYRVILPLIYHLIAGGKFEINISEPINEHQQVRIGNIMNTINIQHFLGEGENET